MKTRVVLRLAAAILLGTAAPVQVQAGRLLEGASQARLTRTRSVEPDGMTGALAGAMSMQSIPPSSLNATLMGNHLLNPFTRLEAETRPSTDLLLNFLMDPELTVELEGKDEEKKVKKKAKKQQPTMPAWSAYLPACLAHVKKVVSAVDRSYTDIQLETVLKQECWLDKKFPKSQEDGFEHQKACLDFAERLVRARATELETGSVAGYEKFCELYYEHKGGVIPGKEDVEELEYEVPALVGKARIGMLVTIIATVSVFTAVASWNAYRKQRR